MSMKNIIRKEKRMMITCKKYAADQLVPAYIIEIHDHDVQRAFPYLLPGDIEGERLVEYWIQGALEDWRFTLLDPLVAELQPDLHVRICKIRRFLPKKREN